MDLRQGAIAETWYRAFTYMFIHAGLLHLAFNMYALWLFGPRIEHTWGSRAFALFYLWCGLGGALFHALFGGLSFMVGASAAVYPRLRNALMPGTPAFTKRLAPGLGLAEDFGDGGSFGLHRCGLLAEGVVAAREGGRGADDERLAVVVEHLRAAGVDPDAPYLRPGSTDDYPEVAAAGRTGCR